MVANSEIFRNKFSFYRACTLVTIPMTRRLPSVLFAMICVCLVTFERFNVILKIQDQSQPPRLGVYSCHNNQTRHETALLYASRSAHDALIFGTRSSMLMQFVRRGGRKLSHMEIRLCKYSDLYIIYK